MLTLSYVCYNNLISCFRCVDQIIQGLYPEALDLVTMSTRKFIDSVGGGKPRVKKVFHSMCLGSYLLPSWGHVGVSSTQNECKFGAPCLYLLITLSLIFGYCEK